MEDDVQVIVIDNSFFSKDFKLALHDSKEDILAKMDSFARFNDQSKNWRSNVANFLHSKIMQLKKEVVPEKITRELSKFHSFIPEKKISNDENLKIKSEPNQISQGRAELKHEPNLKYIDGLYRSKTKNSNMKLKTCANSIKSRLSIGNLSNSNLNTNTFNMFASKLKDTLQVQFFTSRFSSLTIKRAASFTISKNTTTLYYKSTTVNSESKKNGALMKSQNSVMSTHSGERRDLELSRIQTSSSYIDLYIQNYNKKNLEKSQDTQNNITADYSSPIRMLSSRKANKQAQISKSVYNNPLNKSNSKSSLFKPGVLTQSKTLKSHHNLIHLTSEKALPTELLNSNSRYRNLTSVCFSENKNSEVKQIEDLGKLNLMNEPTTTTSSTNRKCLKEVNPKAQNKKDIVDTIIKNNLPGSHRSCNRKVIHFNN